MAPCSGAAGRFKGRVSIASAACGSTAAGTRAGMIGQLVPEREAGQKWSWCGIKLAKARGGLSLEPEKPA